MNTSSSLKLDFRSVDQRFFNVEAIEFAEFICEQYQIFGTTKNLIKAICGRMNSNTFECWASNKTLANELQVSVSTIKTHKKLIDGVVNKLCRTRKDGATRTNLYTFAKDLIHNFREYRKFRARKKKAAAKASKHRGSTIDRGGSTTDPNKTYINIMSATDPMISVDKLKFCNKFSCMGKKIPLLNRLDEFEKFKAWYSNQEHLEGIWLKKWLSWHDTYQARAI